MDFFDDFKDKVNSAGKYVLPIVLTLVFIAIGVLLLGAVGSGLWFCICWCLERTWKILLVGLIIFLIFWFFN